MSDQNPRRECWDCGGTTFELVYVDNWNLAECTECGGRIDPEKLYLPDEHGRGYYDVEMTHGVPQ